MQWWELTTEELAANVEAQRAKSIAYYNVFYGSAEGRQVLFDLQRICYQGDTNAVAALARIGVYDAIKTNCGANVESEMTAIEAEAGIITQGE